LGFDGAGENLMARQMPRRGRGCCARAKFLGKKTGPEPTTGLLTTPGFDAIRPRSGRVTLILAGVTACRKTGPEAGL